MNTPENNKQDPASSSAVDETLVKYIHEMRPAVAVEDIREAIRAVGPNEREVMEKLDMKDHA